MVTITMKQAETFKTLLTKANKGTHWLETKMEKATTAAPKKVAKKAAKKVTKKVSKK